MGLANLQQYSLTKHFKQRAFERFGIPEEKCLKWFRVQAQTMELCDNPNNKDPHQQRFHNKESDNILQLLETLLGMTNEARLKMSVVSTEWMNDFNTSLHQLQSSVETMQRHLNLFN